MTSLTEQLSAVRQSQWNTQLDLIDRLGSRTLDRSERLIDLNIKTSRASVEQAAGVVRQLFDVREPRDLFALGAHAQDQWQQLFAYGRALMGIAAGAGDDVAAQAPTLRLLPAPSQVVGQIAVAVEDAATVGNKIAGAGADIGTAADEAVSDAAVSADAATAPVADAISDAADMAVSAPTAAPDADADAAPAPSPVVAVAAHPAPEQSVAALLDDAIADANVIANVNATLPAKAKPLVEALYEATHAQAGIAHPLAATVPLEAAGHVELPHVTPADHAPAVPSQGPAAATRERRTAKRK